MKYVLDAYNVIGSCEAVQLSDSNKEAAFIDWIKQYIVKGVHLVLVFDGQNEFVDFPMKEKLPGITKVTTGIGRSADDYIKDVYLGDEPASSLVVVTSDNDILRHAKRAKVKTMSSIQFLNHFCKKPETQVRKRAPKITKDHVDYWLSEFGE